MEGETEGGMAGRGDPAQLIFLPALLELVVFCVMMPLADCDPTRKGYDAPAKTHPLSKMCCKMGVYIWQRTHEPA